MHSDMECKFLWITWERLEESIKKWKTVKLKDSSVTKYKNWTLEDNMSKTDNESNRVVTQKLHVRALRQPGA